MFSVATLALLLVGTAVASPIPVNVGEVLETNGATTAIGRPFPTSIAQLANATPDLSTLVAALQAADLVDVLSGPGPFTVFAPSNEAFEKLPPLYLKLLLDPANVKTLKKILLYHVVAGGAAYVKDLKNGETVKTAEGENVTVGISKRFFRTVVQIDNATVTTADITASNGVVHIIDTLLMPQGLPPAPPVPSGQTIVDFAASNPDLSTLVTVLTRAGLVDTLNGDGPFTVFAPSNEAFAALPAGALANLLQPTNKAQLVELLTYHVVGGSAINSGDIPKGGSKSVNSLVAGDTLTAFRPCTNRKCKAGKVFINPFQNASSCTYGQYSSCYAAQVTSKDNDASNGVVHIINSVLSLPNHLYFRTLNGNNQCGEVDAAPRMPQELFDPANAAKLKAYAVATVALYTETKLAVGQCKDIGYTVSEGRVYADWAPPSMMGPICITKCGCNFPGYESPVKGKPPCTDQPDDSSAGKFCSLCGPKYNGVATINAFGPSTQIVDANM